MWAYFIMPAYNPTTGGPMSMFKNSTKETKEFEKIILEIEKKLIFKSLNNFLSII